MCTNIYMDILIIYKCFLIDHLSTRVNHLQVHSYTIQTHLASSAAQQKMRSRKMRGEILRLLRSYNKKKFLIYFRLFVVFDSKIKSYSALVRNIRIYVQKRRP